MDTAALSLADTLERLASPYAHEAYSALTGELSVLEAAWREAEKIAHISDNLLVPESAEEFIERHRSSEE